MRNVSALAVNMSASPLANPAGAPRQLLGVGRAELLERMAQAFGHDVRHGFKNQQKGAAFVAASPVPKSAKMRQGGLMPPIPADFAR